VLFSEAERSNAHFNGRRALLQFQYLAQESLRRQTCLFKLQPKGHAFDHTVRGLQISRYNPLFFECWTEEDFMGKMFKCMACEYRRGTDKQLHYANTVFKKVDSEA